MSTLPPTLPTGLAARYTIRGTLGAGGFGIVFRAEDSNLRREVALKLLRSNVEEGVRARFAREAAVLARLRHPGVVEVFDFGTVDGISYLTMELLAGTDLGTEFPDDPIRALLEMAAALDAVHAERIVHRDLKPSNVLVSPDRGAVLIDFGLAADQDATRLTRSGARLGTPFYMAPEQLAGKPATSASDWYAWGAVGFYLAEQRPPHDRGALLGAFHGVPLPPVEFRWLDPEGPLALLLVRAMDPDPGRRPSSEAEIRKVLESSGSLVETRSRSAPADPGHASGSGGWRGPRGPEESAPPPGPGPCVPPPGIRQGREPAGFIGRISPLTGVFVLALLSAVLMMGRGRGGTQEGRHPSGGRSEARPTEALPGTPRTRLDEATVVLLGAHFRGREVGHAMEPGGQVDDHVDEAIADLVDPHGTSRLLRFLEAIVDCRETCGPGEFGIWLQETGDEILEHFTVDSRIVRLVLRYRSAFVRTSDGTRGGERPANSEIAAGVDRQAEAARRALARPVRDRDNSWARLAEIRLRSFLDPIEKAAAVDRCLGYLRESDSNEARARMANALFGLDADDRSGPDRYPCSVRERLQVGVGEEIWRLPAAIPASLQARLAAVALVRRYVHLSNCRSRLDDADVASLRRAFDRMERHLDAGPWTMAAHGEMAAVAQRLGIFVFSSFGQPFHEQMARLGPLVGRARRLLGASPEEPDLPDVGGPGFVVFGPPPVREP